MNVNAAPLRPDGPSGVDDDRTFGYFQAHQHVFRLVFVVAIASTGSSYKRVKGRSHTVEKRKAIHPQKPHATSQPSRVSHTPSPLAVDLRAHAAQTSCSLQADEQDQ